MILLAGLPGSGKSTWAQAQGLPVLSSDAIRGWLVDDQTDQTIHSRVFALLRNLLRQRLELRRPVTCIDATNLTPRERRPYIKIAQMYGAAAEAVFFAAPVEVCSERNRRRNRIVPDAVIESMAARLIPPSEKEGFSKITLIR